MQSSQEIVTLLKALWEEGGPHAPISKASQSLSAAQAFFRPAPERHSIWQNVMHMAFWREHLVSTLKGEAKQLTDELLEHENWPPHPDPADSEAWNAARSRLEATQQALVQLVASLDEARLQQPRRPGGRTSLASELVSYAVHDAYHVGQIMLLRALQGLAPLD
ncbi:MAG: DinB family protein [Bacillota bacterium]